MNDNKDTFHVSVGFLALGAALAGFAALFFFEVPSGNKDAMNLVLGYIIGWASAVIQSEYGASTVGKKAANAAIDALPTRAVPLDPGTPIVQVTPQGSPTPAGTPANVSVVEGDEK